MKPLLIINTTAGVQRERHHALLETAQAVGVDVATTQGVGHATEIARHCKASRVIVAGGDDTIREVIGGLGQIPLGIVPLGSFNIFARSLLVADDPFQAFQEALTGIPRPVDLATIDGVLFNESAGVGLIAEAFAHAPDQSLKGASRWLAGARAAFQALVNLESARYSLLLDNNVEITVEAINITVANVALIGSGVPWIPKADPTDGKLDVVVIAPQTPGEVLTDLPAYLDPKEQPGSWFQTSRITLKTVEPSVFRYDGQVTEPRTSVYIECLPGALQVCNSRL